MNNRLIIIGTSHIALESFNEVKSKIEEISPDIIALELDGDRFHSLLNPVKTRPSPFKIGLKFWIINSIGAFIEKKLGKRAGLEPGAEMKIAIKLAKEKNIKISLIDQPIQITFSRLLKNLTLKEKFNFVIEFLKIPFIPFVKKTRLLKLDLKKVPSSEIISLLMVEVKKKFPTIYEVLINERNIYMANRLKLLRQYHPDAKIIAIVGAGHKKGIELLLKEK
ncbi:TraB/GumN family protein [Candidatus Woesearchaeota archaeon]|nr:TraB/GumN family protein [Candidatus Woesearchaeota archaeon]